MADYISRDTILEKLNKKFCAYCPLPDCDTNCKLHYLLDAVKEEPAADVRPVVHGGWRPNPRNPFWLNCTVCGYGKPDRAVFNFCPNCGADMREARKGERDGK